MSEQFSIEHLIEASYRLDQINASEVGRIAFISDRQIDEMIATSGHHEHGAFLVNEIKAIRRGEVKELCGFAVEKEGSPSTTSVIEVGGVKFEYRPQ